MNESMESSEETLNEYQGQKETIKKHWVKERIYIERSYQETVQKLYQNHKLTDKKCWSNGSIKTCELRILDEDYELQNTEKKVGIYIVMESLREGEWRSWMEIMVELDRSGSTDTTLWTELRSSIW